MCFFRKFSSPKGPFKSLSSPRAHFWCFLGLWNILEKFHFEKVFALWFPVGKEAETYWSFDVCGEKKVKSRPFKLKGFLYFFGSLNGRIFTEENSQRFEVLLLFLNFKRAPTYAVHGLIAIVTETQISDIQDCEKN